MTEQYQCQSYVDDGGVLHDCTCGQCDAVLQTRKFIDHLFPRTTPSDLDKMFEDETCMCGGSKLPESDFCKDCI